MKAFLAHFAKSTSGATAIEYALIASIVSVVIIGALVLLGPQLAAIFTSITASLTSAS